MFGKRITLFKLLGFSVSVDASWIVIAALVTWSLANGFFPQQYKNLSVGAYWLMGAIGAVGLFASIVFHEMCHSLVARRFGLPMKGITLFIFGGVAEMDDEPPSAKAEFMMAIAGPFSSIGLALGFFVLYILEKQRGLFPPGGAVIGYLAAINGLLAVFNLIPAFPLDGGRVLRAALWSWKGDVRWATSVASRIGGGFGTFLIVMGVLRVIFANDFVNGMWSFLIGLFLRGAAGSSYRQLLTRQALHGEPVSRFMETTPVTVPPSISLLDLVEDYVYKYHFKMFPVVEGEELVGCITTQQIKEIPREDWQRITVGEVAKQCSTVNTIRPDSDSLEALAAMNQAGLSRLMVVDNGRLAGIVSLKDMLKFLALKIELEDS